MTLLINSLAVGRPSDNIVTLFVSQSAAMPLTVLTAGTGSGTVSKTPDQVEYLVGMVVTLTATPNVSSTFTGWSGDCTNVIGVCVVTMDAPKSVTATFDRVDYFVYLPLIKK